MRTSISAMNEKELMVAAEWAKDKRQRLWELNHIIIGFNASIFAALLALMSIAFSLTSISEQEGIKLQLMGVLLVLVSLVLFVISLGIRKETKSLDKDIDEYYSRLLKGKSAK